MSMSPPLSAGDCAGLVCSFTVFSLHRANNSTGGGRLVFSGRPTCRPCVRCPSVPPDAIFTSWKDFDETWYKRSSREWSLLNRFSRSKVKGQGHSDTKCTFAAESLFRGCGVEFRRISITEEQTSVRCTDL